MYTIHHAQSEIGATTQVIEIPSNEFQTDKRTTDILRTAISGMIERLAAGGTRITYLTKEIL